MESLTRRTAVHLHRAGFQVEVLTTCIRDFYADWASNHYRPGVETTTGPMVRRFAVMKRDHHAFDQVNQLLMQGLPISVRSERTFIVEMMRCPGLYQYIADNCQEYIFFFIPYMFATTYFGAQICPERSVVIPCLHDESYARLNIYGEVLPQVNAMILLSHAELQLAGQLYGNYTAQARHVIGAGVDVELSFDAERFRRKYELYEPFVLYSGRRESGKNTPLLLEYWRQFVRENQTDLKLVLIGPGEIKLTAGESSRIIDLGFLPRQDKNDAYAAATVLCQPSLNESFSLVIMESWLSGTPVLVHGDCAVTREHCSRCNGGLFFTNQKEFAATITYMIEHPAIAHKMGLNGRRYVLENFQWPMIIARYSDLINGIAAKL
jgi:glycosyltransferase involved in cell wall biosynthesis